MTWWDERIGDNRNWGHPAHHPQRAWLVDHVGEDESVLELGYGTGKDYSNLKDRVYRGYDLTTSFQRACLSRWPDADFRIGDVTDLPEPDASWDVVFCRHLLEHVEDWKTALSEMWRVAANRLMILSWRPLWEKPTVQTDQDVCCWQFNRDEFEVALEALAPYRVVQIDGCAPIYVVRKDG